jgi:hypothetical protein
MSDLDVGSASPPTADVPILSACAFCGHQAAMHSHSLGGGNMACVDCPHGVCRQQQGADRNQPAYDAVFAYIRSLGDRLPHDPVRRNATIWRAVRRALDALDHSGVAGEPEATTKEAPEIDSPAPPTQLPTPEGVRPAAADVAGGVVVPDEAVRAYIAAWWHAGREGNQDEVRVGLAAAAPLIAAQERARIAALLRQGRDGRLEYATLAPEPSRLLLESEAATLDAAAQVVEGDLGPLLSWLPSWRWTSEMAARVEASRKAADRG